jgi:hypothetical protein
VTPKIGIWNFKYSLPRELPQSGRVVTPEIQIKSRLSLGLEVGAEYRRDTATVRIYGAVDRVMPRLSSEGDSLFSNRLGVDLYWSGASSFEILQVDFHPTFLGFLMRDQFTMNQSIDVSAEATIQDATVESSYLGFGVAFKW